LLNRAFDVVLPLLLAFMMFGLLWGVPVLRTQHKAFDAWMDGDLGFTKLGLDTWQVPRYLQFGLPALCCLGFFFRPVQFGLGVAAILLVGHLPWDRNPEQGLIIHQERSFNGILTVNASVFEPGPEGTPRRPRYHALIHGNINHGVQRWYDWDRVRWQTFLPLDPAPTAGLGTLIRQQLWTEKHYPVAYFHPDTPYGQMFLSFRGAHAKKNVAIIGLGTGGLSGYAYPGQKWTYFELDPAVERIARDGRFFTYLGDCKERGVDLRVILGDARIQLEKLPCDRPEDKFDVIAFDAFTSDAIPIHLVTNDALKLYLSKLTDDGIVVFHISNRYVDLVPVIAELQRENHLAGLIQDDGNGDNVDHYSTEVAILARRMEAFGNLALDPRWRPLEEVAKKHRHVPLWTDQYSNLLGVFKWKEQKD
jgi:hypothetical protein